MTPGEALSDANAERIVAAWLVNCMDIGSADDWARADGISAEHFDADPTARAVFIAARAIKDAGRHVGHESVGTVLAGSISPRDLHLLTEAASTSAYFAESLAALRDCFRRRKARLVGLRLVEAAEAGEEIDPLKQELDRVLDLPRGASTGKWPLPVAAAALCATPPTTPPVLIDGALYRGGTLLLAGPSKAAKTWTMMDLGIAVATGGNWLGFSTTAAPVLYLNLELPDFVAEQRLRTLCDHRGISPPSGFILWNLRGHAVTVDDLERELPSRVAQHGIGLVVIDPHYKVSATSGAEENSNDSQGALLARLEALTSRNGVALAIAHHFAKGEAASKNAIDRASGGGVFARWPDAFVALTPHEEEGAMTMEAVLRAFAPVAPCVLRWEFPAWVRDNTLDPAKLKKAGRADEHPTLKALEALRDGMSSAEWQRATGWSEGTFRRKRDMLVRAGTVRLVAGQYYRGEKA
jgi:hypothetical protein